MRLSDLRPGRRARIVRVSGDSPLAQRLLELGFIAGADVEVIRRAPFGGPLQLALGSTRLSIRRDELVGVELGE